MNQHEFIQILKKEIQKLPEEERREILADFEEHFAMGKLDGKTEEEMAAALGNPKTIGRELVANYQIEAVENDTTIGNFLKAVWVVLGLGFFNLVIVLGPFLVIASLVFAVWAIGVSFIATPVLVLIDTVIYPDSFQLFDLFNSFLFCGIGIFVMYLALTITKYCMEMFIRYLKYNLRLVKGGLNHA